MRCLGLSILLPGILLTAQAAENLTPETVLPEHQNKEAWRPGAAFGKDVFLLVWQAVDGPQTSDLVACRVDKTGKVLDAKPFIVSQAKDDQERPRIAYGLGVFLVVWQDLRNEKDYDTYAARVTPEGKVLDPEGILVAGGPSNQSRPRLAFDGANFFVTWEDLRNGKCYEVYAARVTPEGKVLDPGGVSLNADKDLNRYMPATASPGYGRSLVVWCGTKYWVGTGVTAGSLFVRDGRVEKDNGSLEGSRSAAGSIGGGGRGGTPVSVVAGKDGYLVLWRNHRPWGRAGGGDNQNCALLMDKEGNFKKGESLDLTGKPHVAMDPEGAWDGSAYVVAWSEQPSVKDKGTWATVVGARVAPDGKSLSGALPVSGTFESPASRACIASDGAGTTLIAYEKHPEKADVPIRVGFRMLTAK